MGRAKPQMVSLCFSTLQSFQWFLWIFSFINSCKLPTAQISHNSTKHCRDTFLWFVPAVWQYYTSCTVFRCCGLWSSLTDRMIYIRDASVPFFVHFGLLTTTPEAELPMGKGSAWGETTWGHRHSVISSRAPQLGFYLSKPVRHSAKVWMLSEGKHESR